MKPFEKYVKVEEERYLKLLENETLIKEYESVIDTQIESFGNLLKKYKKSEKRIKELEEENKKLNELVEFNVQTSANLTKINNELQDRINKAIEYIEKNSSAFNGEEEHLDKVYTILKGVENDKK